MRSMRLPEMCTSSIMEASEAVPLSYSDWLVAATALDLSADMVVCGWKVSLAGTTGPCSIAAAFAFRCASATSCTLTLPSA